MPGRVWDLGRAALVGQSRPLWAVRGLSWPDATAVAATVPQGHSPVVFFLGQPPEDGLLKVPRDSVIDLRTVVNLARGALAATPASIESQLRGIPPQSVAKKSRKRSSRAAAIDAIKQALRVHIRAARDHAHVTGERNEIPVLLARPSQQELADQLRLHPSAVSRALHDASDRELAILWQTANDIDQVMKFKG